MRAIDADELKKCVLKWLPEDPCGKQEKEMPFETDICVSMLMEIDKQPTIQPKQRWIPCSERLPKTDNWRTEYIVTYDRGYKEDAELKTTCMSWENTIVRGKPVSRWIWNDRLSPWKVVAWREMLEPYNGGIE